MMSFRKAVVMEAKGKEYAELRVEANEVCVSVHAIYKGLWQTLLHSILLGRCSVTFQVQTQG